MTVENLLSQARDLGAEFIPYSGGNLRVRAPAPLPDELMDQLRQYRTEIYAIVQANIEWSTDHRIVNSAGPGHLTLVAERRRMVQPPVKIHRWLIV